MPWNAFWNEIGVVNQQGQLRPAPLRQTLAVDRYKNLLKVLLPLNIEEPDQALATIEESDFTNIRDRCLIQFTNARSGKNEFHRIDSFYALHWEILYCLWVDMPIHVGTQFTFPAYNAPQFGGISLDLGSNPRNYLLLCVVPALFHRGCFDDSAVEFASQADRLEVQEFLLLQICNRLKAKQLPGENKTLEDILENHVYIVQDPENSPWEWLFLLGKSDSQQYVDTLADQLFTDYRQSGGNGYHLQRKTNANMLKSPLALKILRRAYGANKQFFPPHRHHFLARLWHFFPALGRKFWFSLCKSYVLATCIMLLSWGLLVTVISCTTQFFQEQEKILEKGADILKQNTDELVFSFIAPKKKGRTGDDNSGGK